MYELAVEILAIIGFFYVTWRILAVFDCWTGIYWGNKGAVRKGWWVYKHLPGVEVYKKIGSPSNLPTLPWRSNDTLPTQKRCILIKHNRGTWNFPADPDKINCVVAYYPGKNDQGEDFWDVFGPGSFNRREISMWCEIPD
jgi:hypothetical protein